MRKAALIVFALFMTYLHSLYILFFYVTEDEYWWPVWTGMTAGERLSSLGLGLFANLGLMAMPFVRAPGPLLRAVLALSLTSGLLISVTWLARDLWANGFSVIGPIPSGGNVLRLFADVLLFLSPLMFKAIYAATFLLNAWFLFKTIKYLTPDNAGEPRNGR